jgi:hypothetical protein
MFDFLKDMICGRSRSYKSIHYLTPGTPTKNSAHLTELLAQDFAPVRDRTNEQCMAFGRFMSVVLLVERKLVRLLLGFDSTIENQMLGQKLAVYKAFLNAIDWPRTDLVESDFRAVIAPLKELKKIRNSMSHDLSIVSFKYDDLRQTTGYIKSKRPDLLANFSECEDEQAKCLGTVMAFGYVFSEQIAHLQLRVGA